MQIGTFNRENGIYPELFLYFSTGIGAAGGTDFSIDSPDFGDTEITVGTNRDPLGRHLVSQIVFYGNTDQLLFGLDIGGVKKIESDKDLELVFNPNVMSFVEVGLNDDQSAILNGNVAVQYHFENSQARIRGIRVFNFKEIIHPQALNVMEFEITNES